MSALLACLLHMHIAPTLNRTPFGARPLASRSPARARVLSTIASMKPCPKHTGACSAYMPDSFVLEGAESGPLKGLTFAAKDLYDVRPIAQHEKQCRFSSSPTW